MVESSNPRKRSPKGRAKQRPTRGTLFRFARVIGQDAAVRLSAHFGGRQLYVPHTPQGDSELVQVVGEIAARKLGRQFGGVHFAVPVTEGKRVRILEARREGKTISRIASELACTTRHVYNVLAEFRVHGGTLLDPPTDDPDLPSEER